MASHQEKSARLVIIEGKDNRDKGKIINLKKSYVIIGRGQADIVLNDLKVSRAHVSLEFNDKTGELTFTDLGSTNGVQVNGELRKTGILKDRDRLKVGNTVFDCQLEFEAQTEIGTVAQFVSESQLSKSLSASLAGPSQLSSDSAKIDSVDSRSTKVKPGQTVNGGNKSPASESPKNISFYKRIPKTVRIGAISLSLLIMIVSQLPSSVNRNPSNRNLESYVSQTGKLLEEKKLDAAKSTALEAGKAFPNHSVPLVLLGNVYFEQRKLELAIDAYQRSLALKPIQLVTYTRLIRLNLILNKRDEAKTLLKQYLPLLESGEPNKKLFIQTGELFLDYPELEEDKNTALTRAKNLQTKYASDDPIGYKLESNLISLSEKSVESIKRSEELLKKGLSLAPRDEWIFDRLFYLKLAQNNPPEALATLEVWIKSTPKSTKPLLLLSYMKFNEKNYLGAIPYLQKILNLLSQDPAHPHSAEAMNLMGQISIQQNQLAEAENFFRQSCQSGYKASCAHPILTGVASSPSNTPRPESEKNSQPREPSSSASKQDNSPKKK